MNAIFGLITKLGGLIIRAAESGYEAYAEPRSMPGQRIYVGTFPLARLAWAAAKRELEVWA